MLPHRRKSWHRWAIALGVLFLLGALGGSYSEDGISFVSKISFSGPSVSAAGSRADSKRQPHFLPNSFQFWDKTRNFPTLGQTTDPFGEGPAYADITLEPENFLPCRGGPFALCFYSGPDTGDPDLSCTVDADGQFASCNCFEIPYGTYFVLIHGILNYEMYRKTVRECGEDGSGCFRQSNKAPVCKAINQGKFMPKHNAEMISTFSLNCAIEEPIGQTDCTTEDPFLPYAGCMTASCIRTEVEGIVDCSCPIFPGPYQVGQSNQACDLDPLVWSAAFNPGTGNAGVTFPTDLASESCTPDIPVSFGGCPLLASPPPPPLPPEGVSCQTVCEEYQSCQDAEGVEVGYTCDATLCTSTCTTRGLLGEACSGLPKCDISEITKLENAAGCSCCASQICDCVPNNETNDAIANLNQEQRNEGISPQCDINGTLCGTP